VTTFSSNYTLEWDSLEEVRTITKKQWSYFEVARGELEEVAKEAGVPTAVSKITPK